MIYTNSNVQQRFAKFKEWALTRLGDGKPYLLASDTDAFEALDPIAAHYGGAAALSAWDRAAAETGIKLKQPVAVSQPIPADFQAQLDNMSGTELRIRLSKDKAFSDLFERFSGGEKSESFVAAEEFADFHAGDWRKLPPNTLARLMTKPAFRKRIDELIAQRSI